MADKPTHEQAQLQLQVYDLRREPRLRQARDWFQQNYHAETLEEAMRFMAPGSEHGTFVGMVIGYWEQTCALLNYGLLHDELFFETNGEFFGIWEQLKAVVPQFREQLDRKSTRLNSSHSQISYAVFCLKKKKNKKVDCV